MILYVRGRQPTARRRRCGPPRHFTRPAIFYCHPARDLFLFLMIDMQQQTAEMILTLFFEVLAKILFVFILVFAMNSTKKRPKFLAMTFLFWYARRVAARWNFVRTECGPLVQKVADPCCTYKIRLNIDLLRRTITFC